MATLGIVTPAAPGSGTGNRVTALRWALRLRELGHRVFVAQDWSGRNCDALIAVHARRSAAAVARFRQQHPQRPVLVLLAGTDIYPQFLPEPEVLSSLQAATRIVALQRHAVTVLPPALRDKVRTIEQSAVVPAMPKADGVFQVCVLAHLRAVKDPLRTAAALALLPGAPLRVVLAGEPLDPELGRQAEQFADADPRFQWLGSKPRRATLRLLAASHLCVVSSLGEGGANVVSEAIAADTPIVATDIPGNTGLLGVDWPALFPVGDTEALARCLARAMRDRAFLAVLQERTRQLRPLVAPDRERGLWRQLLAEVLPREPAC